MNEFEYGGYLPLELSIDSKEFFQSNQSQKVVRLNSGRATFYFAARFRKFKRVFLPYFTCANTEDPFKHLGIEVKKYYLDSRLLPMNVSLGSDEVILWTNYFGNARDEEIDEVCKRYPNLIIDNCHAFFTNPRKGAFNCYSPRKFFGVPDGGYLVSEELIDLKEISTDLSYENFSHLLQQIDCGTNEGYVENLKNERRLDHNYLLMSKLTRAILKSINYEKVREKRWRNFLAMHYALKDTNQFSVNLESKTQMYYPFKSENKNLRQILVQNKLYTPFWWSHVLEQVPPTSIEYDLSLNMIHLPIDQRYSISDIETICKRVKKFL